MATLFGFDLKGGLNRNQFIYIVAFSGSIVLTPVYVNGTIKPTVS